MALLVMQWVLVGLFVLIGVIATGAGVNRIVRRESLRRHGSLADGTVVAIRHATVEASSVFAPVVAFATQDGTVEVTGAFACPCFYKVGQHVPVCYAPHEPGRAVILTQAELVKAWGLLVGGVVLIGIGAVLALII